jgi:hypothetical protein
MAAQYASNIITIVSQMNTSNTFPVHYPLGGKMLLMQWWTNNERGHVVLAQSERVMHETARSVFKKHPGAEIYTYLEIDIVAPSKKLCELYTKFDYQDKVNSFENEITWRLKELVAANKELPSQFKICDRYESTEDPETYGVDSNSVREWKEEIHANCKNCNSKFILGMSKEAFYDKHGERWHEADARSVKARNYNAARDKRLPSKAEQASDDELLWCATANFGHHSKGIHLVEVDKETPTDFNCKPLYLSEAALFFYRKLSELDSSSLKEILDDEFRISREKRKADEDFSNNRRQRETENRFNQLIDFFK